MRFKYLILAACIAAAIGCKKADDAAAPSTAPAASTTTTTTGGPSADTSSGNVVGKWAGTTDTPGVKVDYEFKDDKTFTQTGEAPLPGGAATIKTEGSGTYTVEGNKLTIKYGHLQMSTEDATQKAAMEKANGALTDEAVSKQPAQDMTIEWKGKDEMVATSAAPNGTKIVATLKREGGSAPADTAGAPAPAATTG